MRSPVIESLRGGGGPLIENVDMREILDSRGTPTLEVSLATRADVFDFNEEIVSKYSMISIGDDLGEDDWNGWKLLTERLGAKVASGRNVSSGS